MFFENKNDLEIYFHITKELNIKMEPKGFDNEVYISESFMMDCMTDIIKIDRRFK